MKNRFSLKLIAAALILFSPCMLMAEDELPPLPKGPLLLTSVTQAQLDPEYWIKKIPDAEEVKPAEGLKALNQDTYAIVRDQVDIFKISSRKSGSKIREFLQHQYDTLKGRKLFGVDDEYFQPEFFERLIKPNEQLDQIPERIDVKWGAALTPASVRALPTDVKMLEQKQDIEFDQLQFTRLKIWTPVAVYHTSADGQWYFIQAPYARGWVRVRDIALFDDRKKLEKYVRSKKFLVVTGESVAVYADEIFDQKIAKPSMGTVFPLAGKTDNALVVWMPDLKKGYLDLKADVHEGFLPFSKANIIRQAFKLLAARYGWGGTYFGRDCSGFTQDVFLSVGVDMPRGSKEQSFVGTQLGHFEYKGDTAAKKQLLDNAAPGITILRMPHHMMIFLGRENGQYYVIHSTWAERYSMTSDAKNRINQVVVSDLSLNGRSYLGPLFDRIISANEIN